MRWYYYYREYSGLIRVRSHRKPHKRPRSYVVREWDGDKFIMPCFPEIGFSTLNKMNYIGSEEIINTGAPENDS